MAKQTRDTQIVSTKGGKLMQRESIDDTLLPDADELKKYKEIDPTKTVSFRCPLSKIDELKLYVNAKLSEWSQGGI